MNKFDRIVRADDSVTKIKSEEQFQEIQTMLEHHMAANKAYMESIQHLPDGRILMPGTPPVLDIARIKALVGQQAEKPADIMAETRRMLG